MRACAQRGFEARIDFSSSDYRVSMGVVRASGAVALVPGLAVTEPLPGIAVRPLRDIDLGRRVDATHRAGGERLPAVAAMVEALQQAAPGSAFRLAAAVASR